MTEDQLELLRDKYVLWDRASREGNMELRDYNRRAAEALKALLSEREDSREAELQEFMADTKIIEQDFVAQLLELRRELEEALQDCNSLRERALERTVRAQSSEASLALAVRALEPFAAFAENMSADFPPDKAPATQGSPLVKRQVTFGDFRAARLALIQIKGEP